MPTENDSAMDEISKGFPSLIELLRDRLNPVTADRVGLALVEAGVAEPVESLLLELREASLKLGGEAVWALPEFLRRCGLDAAVPWLDVGVGLAQASGALALRYFKESPLILGVVEDPGHRRALLQLVLELLDRETPHAGNCALEFFKKGPELLLDVGETELSLWAELGMDLSERDFVLGVEFFRESPAIARAVPQVSLKEWIELGMKLVTTNSLGKTDYVGTLEFLRSSPALLREVPEHEVRQWIIRLGSLLADHSPPLALKFLAQAHHLLLALPSEDWRLRVLKYGMLIADRDAEATIAYLNRVGEIVNVGGMADDRKVIFERWFGGGIEVLGYSPEGARAYFSLETRRALSSVEEAMSGVPLRQVSRSLKLFAQGLCGTDVTIDALSPTPEKPPHPDIEREGVGPPNLQRPKVSEDGTHILLPPVMRQGLSRAENVRWYMIMTAHEAGHLEFGTYRVSLDRLRRLGARVQDRYGSARSPSNEKPIRKLSDLLALYPQPGVMRDLWEILEDGRVEFLLQSEYPGLREDLNQLTQSVIRTRSVLHGMTAREMVVDALLLRFAGQAAPDPGLSPLEDLVERVWDEAKTILRAEATAEDAIELADRIYRILDDSIGSIRDSGQPWSSPQEENPASDLGAGPRAAEETASDYRPVTNWAYRGAMDPDCVRGQQDAEDVAPSPHQFPVDQEPKSRNAQSAPGATRQGDRQDQGGRPERQQEFGQSPLEQWLNHEGGQTRVRAHQDLGGGTALYDEWDGGLQDYRPRWCRVVASIGPEGSPDFADRTLNVYGPLVRMLRRYFEAIRPMAFQRLRRQTTGEEVDVDAVVERVVQRRARQDPDDRVYARREKRERQVAVAFLLDMSGSTGRQIGDGQRRVIDVEKEGLLLLSEALTAIGDHYALYAYSGQGRGQVDLVTIKDFDESLFGRSALRIGAIAPRQQNRDGAAIRHTVRRLRQQAARTRLLVLISDGKPLDDGYGDEYALEDTKMALREARMQGVHPFCITVDQSASDYLKRMYGEVGFVVVDEVGALPARLPNIYRRLTM